MATNINSESDEEDCFRPPSNTQDSRLQKTVAENQFVDDVIEISSGEDDGPNNSPSPMTPLTVTGPMSVK